MLKLSGMVIAQVFDQTELFFRRFLMMSIAKVALVTVVFLSLGLPAVADDVLDQVRYARVTPPVLQPPVVKDDDLARKYSDFQSFAKSKVKQLNKNQRFSHSRMKVTKQ